MFPLPYLRVLESQNMKLRKNVRNKGKYFGQKCLFLPQPLSENMLITSLFSGNKNNQNYEIWFHLARSAEIFEYIVLTLAETVINGKKTGKNRGNRRKTGKILGFRFSCSTLFLPCFLESLFLLHPGGGAPPCEYNDIYIKYIKHVQT